MNHSVHPPQWCDLAKQASIISASLARALQGEALRHWESAGEGDF